MASDSGEIVGGLLGGLSAREENDASEFGRDMVFENFGSPGADFFGGRLGLVLFAGENHTTLEDTSAKVDFVFVELIEEGIEDTASS